MRLLLDEMYPAGLAVDLREAGFDVVAVLEVPELVGVADRVVLEEAARINRVIVTENVRDFVALAASPHAGILLVSPRRYQRTPRGIGTLRHALEAKLHGPAVDVGAVEWL